MKLKLVASLPISSGAGTFALTVKSPFLTASAAEPMASSGLKMLLCMTRSITKLTPMAPKRMRVRIFCRIARRSLRPFSSVWTNLSTSSTNEGICSVKRRLASRLSMLASASGRTPFSNLSLRVTYWM